MHSKVDIAKCENIHSASDNVIDLWLVYEEAIQERKETENNLAVLNVIGDGTISALEILLRQGGDMAETTGAGKTAFHVAASNGFLDIIKLLLKMKLERNTKDNAGRSALRDVARGGHINVFQELVAAGLRPGGRDNNNEDPFCETCRNGHQEFVREILGAHLSSNYSPPTIELAQTEHTIIKQSLSTERRDWIMTICFKKYIGLAIRSGYSSIAATIVACSSNQRILAYAIKRAAVLGDNQLVISILKQKDQLLTTDTLLTLHYAVMYKHISVAKTLLEEEIPVGQFDLPSFQKSLLQAIRNKSDDIASLLIDKGANSNSKYTGDYSATALINAAKYGNAKIVVKLLQAGADAEGLRGMDCNATPLYHAVMQGNEAIVKLLVKPGANVNATFNRYCTALQEAASSEHEAIVTLLLEAGTDFNPPPLINSLAHHCKKL
ncbi:hypothetical protein EYC80_006930 [Monilinia laxa]|uniref:Uncharacterized protein n=1 Tax=Monilinia laxa TaxID=61186 RepID=A0A5N6JZU0_MONLA|nr:hypothetical protein EYC80_006930 [Monilinia laxa]